MCDIAKIGLSLAGSTLASLLNKEITEIVLGKKSDKSQSCFNLVVDYLRQMR